MQCGHLGNQTNGRMSDRVKDVLRKRLHSTASSMPPYQLYDDDTSETDCISTLTRFS